MDYKKTLEDLEDFAQKEYLKLIEEYPVMYSENNMMWVESPLIGQEIKKVTCKITFNYAKIHVFMWHGNTGSGSALIFDKTLVADVDEDYIRRVVKWRTKPFKMKTKTIKFFST